MADHIMCKVINYQELLLTTHAEVEQLAPNEVKLINKKWKIIKKLIEWAKYEMEG